MFYAYVIKSINSDFTYKGHTDDLDERLKSHNNRKVKSTKHFVPFKLVYYEEFETRAEAISREKYFKTVAGRKYLSKILAKIL